MRRRGALRGTAGLAAGANSLPHLRAMDRDVGRSLESQPHAIVLDLENRDLEQLLKAASASDDDRLKALPRQDQHG